MIHKGEAHQNAENTFKPKHTEYSTTASIKTTNANNFQEVNRDVTFLIITVKKNSYQTRQQFGSSDTRGEKTVSLHQD